MKTRNRVFAIFALFFNILILGSTSYGVFLAIMDVAPNYLELLKYFTIDSNLLLAVASLMMLPCNIIKIVKPEKPYVPFFKNLKFAAAVSTTITLVIAYGFLATMEMLKGGSYLKVVLGDIQNYPIYTRNEFFLHTLAPALAIISVIFDKDARAKYKVVTYGFIPLAVYAVPYIAFAVVPGLKSVYGGDWYGFLNFSLIPANDLLNTVALSAIALVGMFLVALLFGTILWALSLIGTSDGNKTERVTYRYVGPVEEPVKEPESPSEPAQEEQPVEEPAPVVAPIQEEAQPEESNEQPIEEQAEEGFSEEVTQTDHDPEEQSKDEVAEEEPQPEDEEPIEEVQEEVEDEEPVVEQVSEPEEIEENPQEPEQNEPVPEEKVEPEEVAPAPVIDEKTPEEPVQDEPKEEKKILWNFQKVKAKPKKGFAKKEPSEKKEPEAKPATKAAPKKETKTTTNKTKNKGGTKVAAAKKEVAKKEAPKKEAPKKAAKKEEPAKFNGKARVYHISQHENGYKVKLAGGEKAIKTFKTQKEAIAYAKELVKTQGGTYLIHSLDGSIRKG